jgi:glycosyltransferase involved in cell wall biosynthesis
MKVLFLYTELADYFLHCCSHLSEKAEVHIVRWPVNKEAPFQFSFSDRIRIYDKNKFSFEELRSLIEKINPGIIICSGWIDKDYLKLVKPWFKRIPTVLTCDTHWKGTLKQRIATLLSPFFLLNRFSHAWVPGQAQFRYSEKLGFKMENIRTGFYCCDLEKFNAIFSSSFAEKKKNFPKRFIYAGRYYDFKGITDLWQAFIELENESTSGWELWCLGTGSIKPVSHPRIKHFGFVQPKDIAPILAQSGVFVLPSRFEPWAVVVQEFAAAGFPILLSREVGAAEAFLEADKNGYLFDKENMAQIKNSLKKIISLEIDELVKMGERSHGLAQKINPAQWVNTITGIYDAHR